MAAKSIVVLAAILQSTLTCFHPVTETNRVLVGYVFQTFYAEDWFNCIQACRDEPQCISYNFQRTALVNGVCELNNCGLEDLCDRDKSLIYSLGYVFQQIKDSKEKISCGSTGDKLANSGGYALRLSQNEPGGDYVIKHGTLKDDLTAITLCLWLKTDDQQHRGTPISYAVPGSMGELQLFDYNSFYFKIMGKHRMTKVSANDGKWHHICVTWNRAGSWKIYKNGRVAKSGNHFREGGMIRAGGTLVLGQEQGELGGGFQDQQSFIGEITGVNIWDHVINDTKVARMNRSCFTGEGNVVKWSEFRQFNISRGVELINQPTCPA